MQIRFYIDQFIFPYLCGYRKGRSTQNALLSLIEKWKKVLDNEEYGKIQLYFSKVFNTINHYTWIAKLHFCFSKESLKLLKSYLTVLWQRAKRNTGSVKWTEMNLEYHQSLYPNHFCLISILTIYFSYLKTLMFVIMQTTQYFMHVIQIYTT